MMASTSSLSAKVGSSPLLRVRQRMPSRSHRSLMTTPRALAVPDAFGYVAGSVAFTALMTQYLAVKVAIARRQYQVPYPDMYAEGKGEDANTFNCIQRAHQNALEYLPNVLALQIVMGLKFPITAAILGVGWAIGRVIYAAGYSSGDPSKRAPGSALAGILYLVLIGGAAYAGVSMSLGY